MLWVRLEPMHMTACSPDRVLFLPLSYDNSCEGSSAGRDLSQLQINNHIDAQLQLVSRSMNFAIAKSIVQDICCVGDISILGGVRVTAVDSHLS